MRAMILKKHKDFLDSDSWNSYALRVIVKNGVCPNFSNFLLTGMFTYYTFGA